MYNNTDLPRRSQGHLHPVLQHYYLMHQLSLQSTTDMDSSFLHLLDDDDYNFIWKDEVAHLFLEGKYNEGRRGPSYLQDLKLLILSLCRTKYETHEYTQQKHSSTIFQYIDYRHFCL